MFVKVPLLVRWNETFGTYKNTTKSCFFVNSGDKFTVFMTNVDV